MRRFLATPFAGPLIALVVVAAAVALTTDRFLEAGKGKAQHLGNRNPRRLLEIYRWATVDGGKTWLLPDQGERLVRTHILSG